MMVIEYVPVAFSKLSPWKIFRVTLLYVPLNIGSKSRLEVVDASVPSSIHPGISTSKTANKIFSFIVSNNPKRLTVMNDSTFNLHLYLLCRWVALFGWASSQHHACDALFGRFSEETGGISFQIRKGKSPLRWKSNEIERAYTVVLRLQSRPANDS